MFVLNLTSLDAILYYFNMCGSGSVWGIRIRIHKNPEYGSGSTTLEPLSFNFFIKTIQKTLKTHATTNHIVISHTVPIRKKKNLAKIRKMCGTFEKMNKKNVKDIQLLICTILALRYCKSCKIIGLKKKISYW